MRAVLILVLSATAGLVACSSAPAQDGRVRVVAAFYPLAHAAARIGGDAVTVTDLTPPGVEPHDLELTAGDLEVIAEADVVIVLDGGFQPAVNDAVEGQATGLVVDAAEGLPRLGQDPHLWLDPTRYGQMAERIAAGLAEAGVDTTGAAAFGDELAVLDASFSDGLEACRDAVLVTQHASFGYLADAYRLRVEPIAGTAPEAEPDPARLADLADLIASEGVTTIFGEPLAPPDVVETLASETGAQVGMLDPLESLTTERLAAGEDYGSVMRDNLAALREGLAC